MATNNFDAHDPPNHIKGSGPSILVCRFFRHGYQPDFIYTAADLKTALVPDETHKSPAKQGRPDESDRLKRFGA